MAWVSGDTSPRGSGVIADGVALKAQQCHVCLWKDRQTRFSCNLEDLFEIKNPNIRLTEAVMKTETLK